MSLYRRSSSSETDDLKFSKAVEKSSVERRTGESSESRPDRERGRDGEGKRFEGRTEKSRQVSRADLIACSKAQRCGTVIFLHHFC